MADGYKLPDGYENEAEFLEEARERFQEAESYDSENRDAAVDDLKFLAGEQWDDQVRSAREAQGRPCLTINQLPQFVAQVTGDIRINRPAIKVRPAEDGDKDIAEVRQGLIRSIESQNKAQMVYAQAGGMQTACGVGNFRVGLDYAGDDTFDRDIIIRNVPDPLAVIWDPLSTECTGRDARYCFVIDEMPRKVFEKAYPDAQPNELGDQVTRQGWLQKDVVRVTEYWVMKETVTEIAMLDDGSVVPVDQLPKGIKPKQKRKTVKRTACMYLITGHKILDGPFEYPISRLPVFRVEGWSLTVEGKRIRWGLLRFAKDPQRLKNYWRSVSAEVLAMAPKSQWISPESAVEGREQDFRDAHRSGDPLLVYNDGQQEPKRVDPPAIPVAVLQEAALNAQDIKDVTGLHDASLGMQSNETSGKAINARDRQGDVATYIYPDNLKEAIAECGKVINELIPIVYDTARTIRVLGEDESAKVQRINDPMDPQAININVGKYDVVVETGPSYSTKRVEAAESMMQFVQAVPAAAQVAADLIAKAQDWPMAEQIGERLKRTVPAELREGEDEDHPSPEQQQQMMMQQQAQMQQQQAADAAMRIELATKQAEMEEAQADADKAKTEAQKAALELSAMSGQLQQQALMAAAAQLFGQGAPPPEQPATAAFPA